VLSFNRSAYLEVVSAGTADPNEGVEDAFEVVAELSEKYISPNKPDSIFQILTTFFFSVRTAKWVGDVFIYTTANRLQYLVGEQTYTITHIDPGYYLLGYIARDGRVYLADKDVNVVSYALSLSVVEYQTVVLRGDMDAAEEILATIPADQLPKIARFLEGQGTLSRLVAGSNMSNLYKDTKRRRLKCQQIPNNVSNLPYSSINST